jgi:hypothetical protein
LIEIAVSQIPTHCFPELAKATLRRSQQSLHRERPRELVHMDMVATVDMVPMFQRSEPQKLMSLEKCDGTDGTVGKVSAMSVISETVAEIREAATCLKLDAKRRLPVNCCGHSKHKGIHQNPISSLLPRALCC